LMEAKVKMLATRHLNFTISHIPNTLWHLI
jgi:hypothetical protein